MGIRNKLLALLLFISLAPLLVVGIEFRDNLTALGNGLTERSSATLMRNARTTLKRIVEVHARILRRENQLLEANARFLASRIEGILYGHEHAATDPPALPSAAQISAARGDYYFLHRGGRQNLDVNFDAIEFGENPSRFTKSEASSLNDLLLPVLKSLKFRYSDLILWVDIELSDKTKITYPKSISRIFLREPQYRDTDTTHVGELTWSYPQRDDRTRLLVFRITAPLKDESGKAQGHVSLVVPVSALIHKSPHLSIFSDRANTFLVTPGFPPDSLEESLKIIAQEQSLETQRGHWGRPGKDTWPVSDEKEPYADMLEAMGTSESGIADMRHQGENMLWAYAPIEAGGPSLMFLVPKADVVMETRNVREFILSLIHNHTQSMGIIVLIVAVTVCAVAIVLSAFFTRNISILASAVARVALGDFKARADVRTNDEIGRLGEAFNRMVPALNEHLHIKNALEVAQQVQKNLLPTENPRFGKHDIAAISEYCYETGGDYYGFIPRRSVDGESLVIAVGDVSGHGIPAALMMASARAYIRSQTACGERLDHVAGRVNELVADDTDQTGRFMTLFLIELLEHGAVRWVRAGHDPALVYNPDDDSFEELRGNGLPLGVTRQVDFELNEIPSLPPNRLIVIGTDGIWETIAPDGEMFGKHRLKDAIRTHRNLPPAEIIQEIVSAVNTFRGTKKKADDMTIAVIRTG